MVDPIHIVGPIPMVDSIPTEDPIPLVELIPLVDSMPMVDPIPMVDSIPMVDAILISLPLSPPNMYNCLCRRFIDPFPLVNFGSKNERVSFHF